MKALLDRGNAIRQSISVFRYGIFGLLSLMATPVAVGLIISGELLKHSGSMPFCAVVGLLPLFGFFSAVSAIFHGLRIRRNYTETNPANRYRKWGMILGVLGVLLNFCVAAMVIAKLFAIAERGYWFDNG